jgi:hypothetical protein
MAGFRAGGGHRRRMELFMRGIKQGHIDVEEVEEALPPELLTAPERWLLYFSLHAADVELRDRAGNVLTPDEIVPEGRRFKARAPLS